MKGNLNLNPEGRVAAVLAVVAEIFEQLGIYATHKVVYCAAIHQQQAVQEAILQNAHPSTRRNQRAR